MGAGGARHLCRRAGLWTEPSGAERSPRGAMVTSQRRTSAPFFHTLGPNWSACTASACQPCTCSGDVVVLQPRATAMCMQTRDQMAWQQRQPAWSSRGAVLELYTETAAT